MSFKAYLCFNMLPYLWSAPWRLSYLLYSNPNIIPFSMYLLSTYWCFIFIPKSMHCGRYLKTSEWASYTLFMNPTQMPIGKQPISLQEHEEELKFIEQLFMAFTSVRNPPKKCNVSPFLVEVMREKNSKSSLINAWINFYRKSMLYREDGSSCTSSARKKIGQNIFPAVSRKKSGRRPKAFIWCLNFTFFSLRSFESSWKP